MTFSEKDNKQISKKGISLEDINKQLEYFRSGFPKMKLLKPAIVNDGIIKLTSDQEHFYESYFDNNKDNKRISKFVPASGAASRMFKPLFNYLDGSTNEGIDKFAMELEKYPFYKDLAGIVTSNKDSIKELVAQKEYKKIIHYILDEPGLNYKNMPKALIKFHNYSGTSISAFEEQLKEAITYCNDKYGNIKLHFTVSPDHMDDFKALASAVIPGLKNSYSVDFDIQFSVQEEFTDTIAVDNNNVPYKSSSGSLLFRPGGHGALLENLDKTEADVIFIKNIDNLSTEKYHNTTIKYKKILGGYLLQIQKKIFYYLERLSSPTDDLVTEIIDFMKNELNIDIPEKLNTRSTKEVVGFCFDKLNRPIRVCGMVKNEGDTGGGPFWAAGSNGQTSLQIVETAQIDTNDKSQLEVISRSTHFNPVDIACGIYNYKNEKFNLTKYRDDNTGFITKKTHEGDEIKALELPGLWNGSMAFWNTLFIEVPLQTFNPVKTVFDLLNEGHQN